MALHPNLAEAENGLAVCLLMQGDFERGWPAYEARLRHRRGWPQPNLPRWNGEPLAGRKLLLVAEEGLGDTLQFLRFGRLLRSQGAHVTLAVQPALLQLLATHPDLDDVCRLGSAAELPTADFYLPLLSVPGVLGTTLSTIPAEIPYLSADAELKAHWREELSKIEGCKIGLTWQAWHDGRMYVRRSIPLAQFAPLARVPGVHLISLQKGAGSEQAKQVDFPVLDFGDRLDEAAGPFMDTAAIIANLNLVVSVDTSIVHLAGALGIRSFSRNIFAANGVGCASTTTLPGIPACDCFAKPPSANGPKSLTASPARSPSLRARRTRPHDQRQSNPAGTR